MAKREKTTTARMVDVIEAFKEGTPLRTVRVKVGKGSSWGVTQDGIKDEVKVKNGCVTYYYWGDPIAILKDGILTLNNCGHEERGLTDRLWRILRLYRDYGHHDCWIYPDKKGWTIGGSTEPYPLMYDIKAQTLLNTIDSKEYYKKLLRTRSKWSMDRLYKLCKTLGPIPQDIEDKIVAKLMAIKFTEAA